MKAACCPSRVIAIQADTGASIRANFSSQLDVRVRGAFDALEFFQTLTLAHEIADR
jgi:hypothetical protein